MPTKPERFHLLFFSGHLLKEGSRQVLSVEAGLDGSVVRAGRELCSAGFEITDPGISPVTEVLAA